ncbi:Uncharacterized protein OS=Isosphaera pallida (strain ATCC 43644 / DSM 9630 / IS1B) GN=Isop_2856 PE=4 SV=1: PSCyt2: PSD1 [Gemmata massiliana]|uniref:Cytochrome c domain-containing protein n=1 Tax=Gemmata massiliana TaxID=1210884 RepID=A0A6P2D5A2_9BACT|nr:DUF1549 and DUF1553 domain-containing protein [Gemmata massiliana]VTR94652.1 Uncharacterized protein OS=Isosphaera pallida (strain ATCC 43644 / DSM 9630 / IS1B) GN=Isop_2856 PE=4 SV=1: PSCyt2: PSD1 [Gemmata massiliana]
MIRRAVPFALLLLLLTLSDRVAAQHKYADPQLKAKDRAHWSFNPPQRPPVPELRALKNESRNPIDAFVLARLEKEGLKSSAPADKLTLLRRVTLDLTGLPPTPAEVDAFLKDDSPDAYEKVVDRLLASPHFGERWATHWLDVVRFAESNGYELDAERPHAWRYRDFVVSSFNADKPYDQFVKEQIAGDLIWQDERQRKVGRASGWSKLSALVAKPSSPDALIATGLHRCGPAHVVSGNLDADVLRQEALTEMVNGVGAAFLGLTFACTRCHDHKFDPISAGDYYRLQAFFGNAKYTEVPFATPAERNAHDKKKDEIDTKTAPLKKQIAELDNPVRAKVNQEKRDKLEPKYRKALDTPADKRTEEQKTLATQAGTLIHVSWDEILAAMPPADLVKRGKLREQLHALEAQLPLPTAAAWAIENQGDEKTFVLSRGEVSQKALEVQPAFPRILVREGAPAPTSRRELAEWLTKPDHPLTARVMVNRVWQHHFGRGIVNTPNDFGTRGDKPTHPELLDWLACELANPSVGSGSGSKLATWSLKHLHRLIVTSSTYQQSTTTAHGAKADPDNKLLWKMSRRRLEAEAIRDSVLTASGTLNRQVGGPSVKVPLEPEVYDLIFTEGEPDGLWPVTPDAKQHTRRSVYLFNKRNVRQPILEAFDQPDTLNACAVRPVSTFAPQALILMNSPFVHEQAKAMAVSLITEAGTDAEKQLNALYRRTVGRIPSATERKLATEFLKEQTATIRDRVRAKHNIGIDAASLPAGTDAAHARALADLCVVLFNTHEFVYIP